MFNVNFSRVMHYRSRSVCVCVPRWWISLHFVCRSWISIQYQPMLEQSIRDEYAKWMHVRNVHKSIEPHISPVYFLCWVMYERCNRLMWAHLLISTLFWVACLCSFYQLPAMSHVIYSVGSAFSLSHTVAPCTIDQIHIAIPMKTPKECVNFKSSSMWCDKFKNKTKEILKPNKLSNWWGREKERRLERTKCIALHIESLFYKQVKLNYEYNTLNQLKCKHFHRVVIAFSKS